MGRANEATINMFGEDGLAELELPPLVRWTMDDVRRVPWNRLTAVSSFSGCGGSSLGLRMAGWRVPYAIEFVPAAADTYEANAPSTYVDRRDIRQIKPEEILKRIGKKVGELDLFEGSPPCASFSAAGMRERGWGTVKKYSDTEQRTDDLFEEWARLLEGLMPRAFLAENVPGMLNGRALEEYAHATTKRLGKIGYRVAADVLNSAHFGVPQDRRRLIFIGYRTDLEIAPKHPQPTTTEPHTTRQALESVPPGSEDHDEWLAESSMEGKAVGRTWLWKRALADGRREDAKRMRTLCALCGEPLTDHRWETVEVGSVKKTKEQAQARRTKRVPVCVDGKRGIEVKDYFLLTFPDLEKPCPTLTATGSQVGAASVVHPLECRKFTPAEAKAICGFPPDFVLTGTREQRYERMGRAVTPPMYAAVGALIAESLTWACESCGETDEALRYDGGDACERCVLDAFAENG